MPSPARRLLIVALLAALTAALHGYRLADAPPHLEIDEILIGLDAHAIATTGRDLGGELLPLYSQTAGHSWYQPLVIYLSALALKVVPLSEWGVRVPAVSMAVVDVVLMFFVARRLFANDFLAVTAALFLALTPAHLIHGRYGMDYLYPVTFVLAWLLGLILYAERPRRSRLIVTVVVLGAGFYSYISSMMMMPLYFLITCLFAADRQASRRDLAYAAGAFAATLLPFLLWFATHPAAYAATVEKYGLYDASRLNAAQGLRESFSYMSVSQRVSMYWRLLNPAVLFFTGGSRVMFSTGLAGVFLVPLAAFLPIGMYSAFRRGDESINWVLLIGFLAAPLPALIVADEEAAIFRALALLPFGVLLATIGVRHLWSAPLTRSLRRLYAPAGLLLFAAGAAYAVWTLSTQGRLTRSSAPLVAVGLTVLAVGFVAETTRRWRIVAICLLAAIPIQFRSFWRDYLTDYRIRASAWLGGNMRGALEEIIDRDRRERVPAVYFSQLRATSGLADGRNEYLDAYWRFYVTKHDRLDLLARTNRLDPQKVDAVPRGSLVLANLGDVATEALVRTGRLSRVKAIPELDGTEFFVVLQR